jgi:hypothetical protein
VIKLSVSKIEEMISDESAPKRLIPILAAFVTAINDWPTEVKTLEQYEKQVREFICASTTKGNIEIFLKIIDFSKYSWEAESLFQVLEVFKSYHKKITLNGIMQSLKLEAGIIPKIELD